MKTMHNDNGKNNGTASDQCRSVNPYLPMQPQDGNLVHPSNATRQIEAEIVHLMNDYAADLSRYAVGVTREKSLVQDGVQEAFLRYFIARSRGQHIANARAWLFRVLRNYLFDCNRKSGYITSVDLEIAADIPDLRPDVETMCQQNESFRYALSCLTPRERECMQLRMEGFGYVEIAYILHIRPGTVAALLARSMKKFREVA